MNDNTPQSIPPPVAATSQPIIPQSANTNNKFPKLVIILLIIFVLVVILAVGVGAFMFGVSSNKGMVVKSAKNTITPTVVQSSSQSSPFLKRQVNLNNYPFLPQFALTNVLPENDKKIIGMECYQQHKDGATSYSYTNIATNKNAIINDLNFLSAMQGQNTYDLSFGVSPSSPIYCKTADGEIIGQSQPIDSMSGSIHNQAIFVVHLNQTSTGMRPTQGTQDKRLQSGTNYSISCIPLELVKQNSQSILIEICDSKSYTSSARQFSILGFNFATSSYPPVSVVAVYCASPNATIQASQCTPYIPNSISSTPTNSQNTNPTPPFQPGQIQLVP